MQRKAEDIISQGSQGQGPSQPRSGRAPARRLRRPSARRSDPMAIGKLVRSRLHKVSIL